MTGICGACEHYCYIHNFEDGCCELYEKEVDFTDDFCCDDFTLDYNIGHFLIKQKENGNLKGGMIYFEV